MYTVVSSSQDRRNEDTFQQSGERFSPQTFFNLLSFVAFFLAMDPLVPLWLLVLLRAAEPPQRTLDVLEVFSGRGHLWQACSDSGLSARGFDNRQAWEEDVALFDGFMLLLLLVLCFGLRPRAVGGLFCLIATIRGRQPTSGQAKLRTPKCKGLTTLPQQQAQ